MSDIKEIKEDIKEIKEDLKVHMSRTQLLEDRQDIFDRFLIQVNTVFKIGTFVVGLSTVATVLLEIARWFK